MIIVGIIIWVVLMVVILRFFQVASEPINELEGIKKMKSVIGQTDLEFSPFNSVSYLYDSTVDQFQVIGINENELNTLIFETHLEERAAWVYQALVELDRNK